MLCTALSISSCAACVSGHTATCSALLPSYVLMLRACLDAPPFALSCSFCVSPFCASRFDAKPSDLYCCPGVCSALCEFRCAIKCSVLLSCCLLGFVRVSMRYRVLCTALWLHPQAACASRQAAKQARQGMHANALRVSQAGTFPLRSLSLPLPVLQTAQDSCPKRCCL